MVEMKDCFDHLCSPDPKKQSGKAAASAPTPRRAAIKTLARDRHGKKEEVKALKAEMYDF